MSVKRYSTWEEVDMLPHIEGEYVTYMDYVTLNTRFAELQAERDYLSEYTDHLVSFSKLPCLPKDLENLREANIKLAQENSFLKFQMTQIELGAPSIQELRLSRDMWIELYQNLQRKLSEVSQIINS